MLKKQKQTDKLYIYVLLIMFRLPFFSTGL